MTAAVDSENAKDAIDSNVSEGDASASDVDAHDDHPEPSLGVSNMKLAMWLFLGSECLLFGALISTYLLSKARFIAKVTAEDPVVLANLPSNLATEFKEAGSVEPIFDIPFTSASSFILLMSSVSMVFAHKAISEGDSKLTRWWLAVTASLGSTFIAGQVYEFTTFYNEGLTFDGTLFGSAFYTLTGFHGVHVTGGIIMLISLLVLAFRGKLNKDRAETVELVGLYWHFVDVVWVLIFTIVYLIP